MEGPSPNPQKPTQANGQNDELTRFASSGDDERLDLEFDLDAEQARSRRGPLGILGEYLLLDRLGAGGMGEVFRAEHRTMNRQLH